MQLTAETFPRLSSRLHFIEFCPDNLKNIEMLHCLSVLEDYVYGVISQYERIRGALERITRDFSSASSQFFSIQVRLDIYYYTLTWDKLRKVYAKFKEVMNTVQRLTCTISHEFKKDFKDIKRRMDHLLGEFRTTVRDEYEHPSLEPKKIGSIMEWGSLFEERNGNISVHVGKDQVAVVRREHIDRLYSLWIKLSDILLQHFSDKPLSSDLLQIKKYVEENIDAIINAYVQCRRVNKNEEANSILKEILLTDRCLTREEVPLSPEVKNKIYSILLKSRRTPEHTQGQIQPGKYSFDKLVNGKK